MKTVPQDSVGKLKFDSWKVPARGGELVDYWPWACLDYIQSLWCIFWLPLLRSLWIMKMESGNSRFQPECGKHKLYCLIWSKEDIDNEWYRDIIALSEGRGGFGDERCKGEALPQFKTDSEEPRTVESLCSQYRKIYALTHFHGFSSLSWKKN